MGIRAVLGTSAQNGGDMRGWFQLVSAVRGRNQPANMQRIREKAADGIRTHDLLHGN
jgi:hypothetical protein